MTDENGLSEKHKFEMTTAVPQISSALAAVESSRAVAEVQASLVIAKANPRDEAKAEHHIMNSCKRVTLAKTAMYLYRRGGTNVTGPTIRLAEMIAGHWGNIEYGFEEVGRGKDFSEVIAIARDLQNNVKSFRKFQVKHYRDKKSGNVPLTQERDIYEMVASMAMRRVRACLMEVIPADIFEMAVDACDATLNGSIGDLKKAVESILDAFDSLGVTKEDVEGYLQRKMESLVPADIVNLRKIHTSIKNGIAPKEEFFREEDILNLNKRFAGKGKGTSTKKTTTKKDPPKSSKPEDKKQEPEVKKDPVKEEKKPDQTTIMDNGAPDGLIACPQAGGMMIGVDECEGKACRPGCPAWEE